MITLDGLVKERVTLACVDSTNRYALEAGRPGLLVSADEQTAGRGRKGRAWFSPPGENIYMTLTLAGADPRWALVTGAAVHTAVAVLAGDCPCLLKWPNDILIEGKKAGGILCEARGGITAIGIGVNVNQTVWPAEIAATAISLAGATGRSFAPAEVMQAILAALETWFALYRTEGLEPVRSYFRAHSRMRGSPARLEDGTPCRVVDISPEGYLEVEVGHERRLITSGDILPDPDRL